MRLGSSFPSVMYERDQAKSKMRRLLVPTCVVRVAVEMPLPDHPEAVYRHQSIGGTPIFGFRYDSAVKKDLTFPINGD